MTLLAASALGKAGGSDSAGKHGALKVAPSSLTFGNVQVGYSKTLTATLSNTGGGDLTIYSATSSGAEFIASGLSTPLTLTPGQSFTFSITFAPQSSSDATGDVTLSSQNNRKTRSIPLTGTGTAAGQLTVSPASLSFGNVAVGKSASLSGTLTATGASVAVSSGTSNSSEFVLSGLSFPFTLQAGQSASFTVGFTPQTSGTSSATLAFESDAASSPSVESLTGTGTNPQQHTVTLHWNPTPSVIAGYDVYRGGTAGGPYAKLNSTLDLSTSYTDTSVENGKTYFYVTTAVDDSGTESGYSNEVQAVIPSP
ncbi:MAG: choice-of-anchor D domain-containing protein [Acidobacteriia bacterium]|nr:choice-of-anchor D domain-containing protein [Terriglobia bacterium]